MNNSKDKQKLNRKSYFFPQGMAVIRSNTARTTTTKMIFCVEQHPHSSIRSTAAYVHVSNSTELRILKDQLHTNVSVRKLQPD